MGGLAVGEHHEFYGFEAFCVFAGGFDCEEDDA